MSADIGVPEHHVEYLAAVMHSAYEDEAARVGWETNPRSKTSWDRVPDENKQAMRAGVRALLAVLFVPEDTQAKGDSLSRPATTHDAQEG